MWLNYIVIGPVSLKRIDTTITFENSLEKITITIYLTFLLGMIVDKQCVLKNTLLRG